MVSFDRLPEYEGAMNNMTTKQKIGNTDRFYAVRNSNGNHSIALPESAAGKRFRRVEYIDGSIRLIPEHKEV